MVGKRVCAGVDDAVGVGSGSSPRVRPGAATIPSAGAGTPRMTARSSIPDLSVADRWTVPGRAASSRAWSTATVLVHAALGADEGGEIQVDIERVAGSTPSGRTRP
jgi:hypothetical protein